MGGTVMPAASGLGVGWFSSFSHGQCDQRHPALHDSMQRADVAFAHSVFFPGSRPAQDLGRELSYRCTALAFSRVRDESCTGQLRRALITALDVEQSEGIARDKP